MTNSATNHSSKPASPQTKRDPEGMIRQLEQFPVEVLEAALLVLRMRQANAKP